MRNLLAADDYIIIGALKFKTNRFYFIKKLIRQIHNVSYPGEAFEKLLQEREEEILWMYEGLYFYNRTLRLLKIRPRSVKEINQFLELHIDNENVIPIILERLTPFLDDTVFAEYFIQKHSVRNPKGDKLLRMLLKEKGIATEIIEKKLANREKSTYDLILAHVVKKEKGIRDTVLRKNSSLTLEYQNRLMNQKMMQYLFTKGFSTSQIREFYQMRDTQ